MGVKHIFVTAPFAWGGEIMTQMLRTFRTYIEDGSLSFTSHSNDDIDYLYSLLGVSVDRVLMKQFQVRLHITSLFFFMIKLFYCNMLYNFFVLHFFSYLNLFISLKPSLSYFLLLNISPYVTLPLCTYS